VSKDSPVIEANGEVDEAQAVLGVARAEAEPGSELDALLVTVERDLYVLMAEIATPAHARERLVPGSTIVTEEMVLALEARMEGILGRVEMPREFVIPGQGRLPALLDQARTVVRRAERRVVAAHLPAESRVLRYLNRLSDLLWAVARWQEGEHMSARRAK
jgi:cob(I)alamin adenosyltransferase